MPPLRLVLGLCLLLAALAFAGPSRAQDLVREPVSIPATFPGGEKAILEALVVRPPGPGPFPLAVMTHGAPRDHAEIRRRTPQSLIPQASEFARRGWAVVIVMRRGYGLSEGDSAGERNACNNPDYTRAALRMADDLREAVRFMAGQPHVDARRVLAVGVSAGGLATVALTANPPPGLVAAISFAGGRGSSADYKVCGEDRLIDTFRTLGRRSRVPMLWIYAENDHFFEPRLARQFYGAFTGAGGRAEFIQAPAIGQDGHALFSIGIAHWTPWVDRFLAEHGLEQRGAPLVAATAHRPPPPRGLRGKALEAFDNYLAAAPDKAFAYSPEGAYGWRSGRRGAEDAAREALANCQKYARTACQLYTLNDQVVGR